MTHTVYLALGSNLGDRQANLRVAVAKLQPEVRVVDCSPVYDTPPWGYEPQPSFLNQVICVETDLDPKELLAYLKKIESDLGREETIRYGPRLIDLDILFYNQSIIQSPPLVIPHPALQERAFVLVPLADLAPGLVHPVTKLTVRQMLDSVDVAGIVQVHQAGCS